MLHVKGLILARSALPAQISDLSPRCNSCVKFGHCAYDSVACAERLRLPHYMSYFESTPFFFPIHPTIGKHMETFQLSSFCLCLYTNTIFPRGSSGSNTWTSCMRYEFGNVGSKKSRFSGGLLKWKSLSMYISLKKSLSSTSITFRATHAALFASQMPSLCEVEASNLIA